jgi:archaellum component FlaC
MISKVNTISMLENMGLKYRYDFWNHSYNDIENDLERMNGVKNFTKKVMSLSKRELKQFKEDYNNYSKDNFNILTNEIYPNSIKKIYETA